MLLTLKSLLSKRFEEGAETQTKLRRYEVLAEELRNAILRGDLKVGEQLPGERDLVALTGLGRGSVREAIRILESEGLLTPKTPGRYGVSIVQNAPEKTVHRQLELFIGGTSVTNRDLIEARLLIEPAMARLAALNRTEDDILRLKAINAEMAATDLSERHTLGTLNLRWHSDVFRASHNELLVAIAIGMSETQHQHRTMVAFGSDDIVRSMIRAHERITESIVAGDEAGAARRMEKHLRGYAETLARQNPLEYNLARLNPPDGHSPS